jgi:hypothetical protein
MTELPPQEAVEAYDQAMKLAETVYEKMMRRPHGRYVISRRVYLKHKGRARRARNKIRAQAELAYMEALEKQRQPPLIV